MSLLVIYPCCMTFRWETANICVVQPTTPPASPRRKMFSKPAGRGRLDPPPAVFSSVLGTQYPREGPSASPLVFHNRDKTADTALFCMLSVLGPCQHLPMELQEWRGCTWARGSCPCSAYAVAASWPTLLGTKRSLCSQGWRNAVVALHCT